MESMNNYFKIGLVALLMFSLSAKAQDLGNNTLIINSGFTPEIKDTKKITHKPTVIDTVYQAPSFKYSIVSSRIITNFEPRLIGAAKTEGEKLEKIYKGYIAAGMGNYATPMVEFAYGLGRSKNQYGQVHFKHLSSAGKISNYIFPGISENALGGNFTKLWEKNKLSSKLVYSRNMFHFYGVNTEDTALTNGHDLSDKANAHLFNKVLANINFGRFDIRKSKMNFNLNMDYYYLTDNYLSRENGVNFKGFVDWKVDFFEALRDQKLGLNSKVDFYNNLDTLTKSNAFIIGLNPYFRFAHKKIVMHLGLNSNIINDTISDLLFFPDFRLNLNVIDDVLNFEFVMGGGAYKTNFNDLSSQNPFINSILPLNLSVNRFMAGFAMYSSISKYINFQLGFDYHKWKNGAFFITDTLVDLQNKFNLVYDDYDRILLKAGASFHINSKLDVMAEARYYVYNMMNELFAWHKPDFDVKLQGVYLIGDKFRLHTDLVFTGPMMAPIYQNSVLTAQTINPWLDFSLGFEYRYKKRIGFFANFNNIAASRYQLWYNYPSFGFNFMAGASYMF